MNARWIGFFAIVFCLGALQANAQFSATDDFESYTGSPLSGPGGSGDWTADWGWNSQKDGGGFLDTSSRVSGVKSLGLYGNAGTSGTSASRPFPACTNELTISWSMRSGVNITKADGAPNNLRRMAFTIRTGNDASHFGNQRISFYYKAGSTNFWWYDGTDRSTTSLPFVLHNVYDVEVQLNPTNRAYSFVASNRTSGASFSYSGTWTTGLIGDPLGSVSFLMRGPTGTGQDVFLDNVVVSSPNYVPLPPLPGLPIKEGATWRYFKGRSMPSNEWNTIAFDDSAGWGGPAPSGFGYGPSAERTTFSDMTNYLSVYIRKPFLVTNVSEISQLTLAVDYDDGFVAYLNGTEIARRNMPAGPVSNTTTALVWRDSSRKGINSYSDTNWVPEEKEFIQVDQSLLVNGTNVIAVSGHNVSLSSSDFALMVELYPNVSLVRKPFLQMPTPGQITVHWRTAGLADSVVEYGYDLSYSGGSVSNGAATRDHIVELPAFPPGTTVYYRVRSGGEVLLESRFVSPKSPDQKFRMVVLSDYGSPSSATAQIVDLAAGLGPDLLITAGDNVQQGMAPVGLFDSHWFDPLHPLISKVPMMPTIGNHDIRLKQGADYSAALSFPTNAPAGLAPRNFAFDYGNAHFVMIDGNAFEATWETTYTDMPVQRAAIISWLTNDLHHTTQMWKFVAYHQPAYTTAGGHHPETAALRDELAPIFERYGVNIAFQGHNHFYERINPVNGVYYWTVGSGGFSIHQYDSSDPKREYLANMKHQYDFLVVDIEGSHLTLRCIDQNGNQLDHYDLELAHPFKMDGILDDASWKRAENGMALYAAIRDNYLYVATQDAGEGSDHFIYVADKLGDMRAANWAKSGQIMQWSAYLADENGDSTTTTLPGFTSWFDANSTMITNFAVARAITPGLNNNGIYSNGVLEGTLHLPMQLGSFPTQLWFAVAPFGTLDGDAMYAGAQVPAGNGNGDIEASEFLGLSTLSIALDAPLVDAGGANAASEEAGMWLSVTGASVQIRSALSGSHSWSQRSGPAGEIVGGNTLSPSFRLTNAIASATNVVLELKVSDSRFDVTDTVTLNFTPVADTDGDGLSDREEETGVDNPLTPLNPNGHITNPALRDSDGDGVSDGDESIAGTDPNEVGSLFQIVTMVTPGVSGAVLHWPSAAGRTYDLWMSTNLLAPWSRIASDLPATPPMNIYTSASPATATDYFAVEAIHRP